MNDIDQKIQAALRRENLDDPLGAEPNIAEEALTVFRGRHRWLVVLITGVRVVALAGLIWAAVNFLRAGDVMAQMRWGALGGLFIALMTMLKLWFWMEMQSNRVLREIKRVELLLIARPKS